MNFEDSIFTEELRISSGEKAIDILFIKYMKEVFSPSFIKKIGRVYNHNLVLKDFKERSNVMAYTQGTKIYINAPMFNTVPKKRGMDYIMHELFHVLNNTHRFPELANLNKRLLNVVNKAVPHGKENEFLTGKPQNIHSDWRGEVVNYLCNNSIKWDVAVIGTKEAYKEILEESGLFNMSSAFWKKRF